MANDKEKIEKITQRLQKETLEAVKEIEDVVVAASEAYAELKGVVMTQDVGDLVSDVVLPKLKLPWYVPTWVAKSALKNSINKVLARSK